jgi:serine/threonine protein kinase
MRDGIIWCPHCGRPHKLGDRFCSVSGKPLDVAVHRAATPTNATKAKRALDVGTTIDGRYRVLRLLGAGGMGDVYEAENLALGRRVAIKVVSTRRQGSDDAIPRLLREAQAVAAIQHPNICDVYDVGTTPEGMPYLVLERLVGQTLEERERRQRKLPPVLVIELFGQILAGLRAAQDVGIVHRDLKPANVFLVARQGFTPVVKLLDFGFAKMLNANDLRTITRPGRSCGTPQYMSPEQLRAEEGIDGRSDIFAVGVMMYEALTGRHPFAGTSLAEIGTRILREDPTPASTVRKSLSTKFDSVLSRAMAKRRDERYRTALDMQVALLALGPERYDDDGPVSTTDTVRLLPRLPSSSNSTPI